MAVLFIVSSASDDDNEALAFFLLFNPIIALKKTSSSALSTRHGAQQGNTLIEWSSNSQVLEIHRRDTRTTELSHD